MASTTEEKEKKFFLASWANDLNAFIWGRNYVNKQNDVQKTKDFWTKFFDKL